MCTDPSRSPKQYRATARASMRASGARANRSANHPRNAPREILLSAWPAAPAFALSLRSRTLNRHVTASRDADRGVPEVT